jgi:hypothetical protein
MEGELYALKSPRSLGGAAQWKSVGLPHGSSRTDWLVSGSPPVTPSSPSANRGAHVAEDHGAPPGFRHQRRRLAIPHFLPCCTKSYSRMSTAPFSNAACSNVRWFVNATLQLQQRNAGSHHLESIRGAVLGGMATDDLRSLQGDEAIPMAEVGLRSLI